MPRISGLIALCASVALLQAIAVELVPNQAELEAQEATEIDSMKVQLLQKITAIHSRQEYNDRSGTNGTWWPGMKAAPSAVGGAAHSAVGDASFLDVANIAVAAAKKKAAEINVPMNIAVVDKFSNLISFSHTDGAWIGSKDIAIKKARTARFFDMPSADIGELSQPGGSLYMIEASNGGLISFGGGLPLVINGEIVGAIGVSGGQVFQDVEVATAGQEAFQAESPRVAQTVSRDQVKAMVVKALETSLSDACTEANGDFGKCLHNVAVVDAGGHLLEFRRMDGAWLGSIDIALKKAKTAAQFCSIGVTGTLGKMSQPAKTLYQIEHSNAGLITFPGGVAIKSSDGSCLGAVGASGGTVEADHVVADAAVKSFALGSTQPPSQAGATLMTAIQAMDAAEQKAVTLGIAQNIVVTDPGGNLLTFTRMTNAWLGSVDIAVKKANMAVKFAMNSGDIGQLSDPSTEKGSGDLSLYQIELSNGGLISFPGGVLVKDAAGGVAYGVGVSGSTVDNDHACASAGAAVITSPEAAVSVTLTEANAMISAAEAFVESSADITKTFDLCVVDQFLDTVAFHRMAGAWRGSIDIACKKAKSSVMFNMPSGSLGGLSHPALKGAAMGSLYGIEHSNNFASRADIISSNAIGAAAEPGGLITFGGGKPLIKDGKLIGGFGVSGSIVPNDMKVCDAGVAAFT